VGLSAVAHPVSINPDARAADDGPCLRIVIPVPVKGRERTARTVRAADFKIM
jgi:hypothetical protein